MKKHLIAVLTFSLIVLSACSAAKPSTSDSATSSFRAEETPSTIHLQLDAEGNIVHGVDDFGLYPMLPIPASGASYSSIASSVIDHGTYTMNSPIRITALPFFDPLSSYSPFPPVNSNDLRPYSLSCQYGTLTSANGKTGRTLQDADIDGKRVTYSFNPTHIELDAVVSNTVVFTRKSDAGTPLKQQAYAFSYDLKDASFRFRPKNGNPLLPSFLEPAANNSQSSLPISTHKFSKNIPAIVVPTASWITQQVLK